MTLPTPLLCILLGITVASMLVSAADLVRRYSRSAHVRIWLEGALAGWIAWGLIP